MTELKHICPICLQRWGCSICDRDYHEGGLEVCDKPECQLKADLLTQWLDARYVRSYE